MKLWLKMKINKVARDVEGKKSNAPAYNPARTALSVASAASLMTAI
jgi:hypothetical protein